VYHHLSTYRYRSSHHRHQQQQQQQKAPSSLRTYNKQTPKTYSAMIVAHFILPSFLLFQIASSLSSAPTAPMLALNYRCTVKPEKRDVWLSNIRDDQQCTRRDEPGNLQFVIGQDVDDPNTFYLHEEFADVAAFQAHCNTPHFARYSAFCDNEQPFLGEPEILFFHPLEEVEKDGADGKTKTKKKRPIHKDAFGLNVNLYPKVTVREEFLKVISNNKKGTDTTEPLALQYTYGESTTVPGIGTPSPTSSPSNVFHFHEQYTGSNHGKEGFEAHASAPHFAAWEEFEGTDPFEKPPEVFFFYILEQ
jgi:quinol monooxygenase YgiN